MLRCLLNETVPGNKGLENMVSNEPSHSHFQWLQLYCSQPMFYSHWTIQSSSEPQWLPKLSCLHRLPSPHHLHLAKSLPRLNWVITFVLVFLVPRASMIPLVSISASWEQIQLFFVYYMWFYLSIVSIQSALTFYKLKFSIKFQTLIL